MVDSHKFSVDYRLVEQQESPGCWQGRREKREEEITPLLHGSGAVNVRNEYLTEIAEGKLLYLGRAALFPRPKETQARVHPNHIISHNFVTDTVRQVIWGKGEGGGFFQ